MNINSVVIEAWGAPKARDYIAGEYLILKFSTGGLFQLLGLLFVFVIIMVLTYMATVWIGKKGVNIVQTKNISIIGIPNFLDVNILSIFLFLKL